MRFQQRADRPILTLAAHRFIGGIRVVRRVQRDARHDSDRCKNVGRLFGEDRRHRRPR